MAGGGLAADRKKSRQEKAHIVLIDESGLLLLPLVRRSLTPRGQPPVLKHRARHRDKVSLIAALSISPVRHHLHLYFRSFPKEHVDNVRAVAFVRQVLRQLPGRVIVIWDGGPMHKGPPVRQLLADYPRLSLEPLPPYAPDLNPVEWLWKHLKYDELPNFAPVDVAQLNEAALPILETAQASPARLDSFYRASKLPPLDTVLTT